MRRIPPRLGPVAAVLLCAAGAVHPETIAVLDLRVSPAAKDLVGRVDLDSLSERVRGSISSFDSSWHVLSGPGMRALLAKPDVSRKRCPADAADDRETESGRILQADVVVAGDISVLDGRPALAMRFFDLHPRSGLLRAGTERIFPDAFSLREGLAGAVGELLGKAVASRGWKRASRPPGPGMVEIPPGCFETGLQVSYREPLHAVCLDGFSMDATEATQAAFQRTMGFNPSRFKDCGPDCPVENVSWRDAEQYCFRKGKRLPTEMQWEYAALCGIGATSSTPIQENALDSIAWSAANSGARPHPVGLKRPNPWGLRDMLGNVSEWTRDESPSYLYSQHPSNLQIDPEHPSGFEGVARGGNWMSAREEVLAIGKKQVRFDAPPSSETGFRCVAK